MQESASDSLIGTYTAQVSTNGGTSWTPLTVAPPTARTVTVATPVGANYLFRVTALASRYGQATPTVGGFTTSAVLNSLPAQSTALSNTLAASPAKTFNVGFTNTSANITGWTIQRGVSTTAGGGVTWTTILVTPSNTGSAYTFSNTVQSAGFYRFRIQATSAAGTTAVVTTPVVQTL